MKQKRIKNQLLTASPRLYSICQTAEKHSGIQLGGCPPATDHPKQHETKEKAIRELERKKKEQTD